MSFNIGQAFMGAIQGFLETGNPYVAGAMFAADGFEGNAQGAASAGPFSAGDSISTSGNTSTISALAQYAQLAEAFGAA